MSLGFWLEQNVRQEPLSCYWCQSSNIHPSFGLSQYIRLSRPALGGIHIGGVFPSFSSSRDCHNTQWPCSCFLWNCISNFHESRLKSALWAKCIRSGRYTVYFESLLYRSSIAPLGLMFYVCDGIFRVETNDPILQWTKIREAKKLKNRRNVIAWYRFNFICDQIF